MSDLAERIKQLRDMMGISQHVFASSLGVNRSHISKIETSAASPSEQLLKSICREFDIREEWLKSGTGPILKNNIPYDVNKLHAELESLSYDSFISHFQFYDQLVSAALKYMGEFKKTLRKKNFVIDTRHPRAPEALRSIKEFQQNVSKLKYLSSSFPISDR
jgi:transcriptional regulator with XRE-family HTH domain